MFLHELKHHQLHHPRINATALLFQIVYWFHPLVWLARKKMVMDRELACDAAVIETIGMCERKAYGRTLLQFIEKKNNPIRRLNSVLAGRRNRLRHAFILLFTTAVLLKKRYGQRQSYLHARSVVHCPADAMACFRRGRGAKVFI